MSLDELHWSHSRVPRGYGHVACAHRAEPPVPPAHETALQLEAPTSARTMCGSLSLL